MISKLLIALIFLLRHFATNATQTLGLVEHDGRKAHQDHRANSVPTIEEFLSVNEHETPGIGFALETSHG